MKQMNEYFLEKPKSLSVYTVKTSVDFVASIILAKSGKTRYKLLPKLLRLPIVPKQNKPKKPAEFQYPAATQPNPTKEKAIVCSN